MTHGISLFPFQDQLLQCHLCTGSVWWLQEWGQQRTVSVPSLRLSAGADGDSLGLQGGGCLVQSLALCSCASLLSCTCGPVVLSLWAGHSPLSSLPLLLPHLPPPAPGLTPSLSDPQHPAHMELCSRCLNHRMRTGQGWRSLLTRRVGTLRGQGVALLPTSKVSRTDPTY